MSSRKGGAYEREIAKTLSLWLTNGESNNELIRSVSSGGWKFRATRQVGDLAPNGPMGDEFRSYFGIECKNREDFSWKHYWTHQTPKVFEWWNQVEEECLDSDLIPMLVYKKNYVPDLVGFWEEFIKSLDLSQIDRLLKLRVNETSVLFFPLEDFISYYSPEELMSLAAEWKIQ